MSASTAYASGAADEPATAAELAASLGRRDPTSLGQLYDDYASRLYTYACGLLDDHHLAADAVHDTILIAYERIDQLREPSKLTAWLYAICRNECHRIHRRVRREGLVDEVPEHPRVHETVTVINDDPGTELDAAEARSLVERALPALSSGDREVLELALRHGLDSEAVADVMGVSVNNARARMSRARASLEQSIGALLLLQSPDECSNLQRDLGTLADPNTELTPLNRKRVVRHLKKCVSCSTVKGRAVRAIAMVTLPLLLAPAWLRDGTLGEQVTAAATTNAPGSDGANNPTIRDYDGEVRFRRDGWPRSDSHRPRKSLIAVGAAAVLVALGTGGVTVANGSAEDLSAMAIDQRSTLVVPGRTVGSNTDQAAGFVGYQSSATGNAQQNGESTAASSANPQGVDQQSGGEGQVQDAATPASSTPQTASAATGSGQATTATSGSKGNQVIDTGPPPGWTPPTTSSATSSGGGTTTSSGAKKPASAGKSTSTSPPSKGSSTSSATTSTTTKPSTSKPTTTTTKPKTTTTTTTTKSTSTTGGATK